MLASKPGLRKHVSLVNINFNLTTLLLVMYRQSQLDDTRHTKTIMMSLLQVILLCIYIFMLSVMIFGQIAIAFKSEQKTSRVLLNYLEDKPFSGQSVVRGLINWSVITLMLLVPVRSRRGGVYFLNILHSYRRAKIISPSCKWYYSLISFLKISLLFYVTLLNLILIVLTTPSIVNPGPYHTSNPTNLKVVYCNAQGFIMMSSIRGNQPILQTNKLLDFQSFIHTEKPDIVIVNETWLNEHINSNELVNEQYYRCFRSDRSTEDKQKYCKKGGGGVIILSRQDIDITTRNINIQCTLPIVSIEIKFKDNSKICLSTFYRYGYSDLAAYLEAERYYRELCRKYRDVIIVGDLNLSTVRDWSSPIAENELENMYVDLFSDLGLTSMVNTRTHKAGNILDLILTNRPDLVSGVSIEPDRLCSSDHYTVSFSIGKSKNRTKPVRKKILAYSKADWDNINRDIRNTYWPNILSGSDITENLNLFKSKLDIILRRWIPVAKFKSRGEPQWHDSEIREMSRVKYELKKRARETGSLEDKEIHENYSARYKQKVLTKKKEFITSVDPCESDSVINKRFWSYIKSNSKCSRIPDSVYYNNRYRTVASDKCELYNTFFCAQFSDRSSYDIDIDHSQNLSTDMLITPSDVYKILKKVKPSKAPGPDGINGHVLKNCCSTLGLPLAMLFNLSYLTGKLPQEWKDANVVPIHKKNDKANVENYRPISLTSLIMKIFEKCVRVKVFSICSDKITSCQHGFLPSKSCGTQMLEYTCDLSVNLNSKLQTDIVYFDFAKAFDSVNHDIILNKLKYFFGVDGRLLNFLMNYLKGRRQRVVIDGQFSTWQPVQSGVPQGSILGPLLFVLFINDIVDVISPDTRVLLYADDMKVWRKINSPQDQAALQADITNLHQWSLRNKMKFHPSKCKVLRSTLKTNPLLTQYTMADTVLAVTENERDLGIIMNPRLLFNKHHHMIVSKSSQKLGLVKRNCSITQCTKSRKVLYLSLVRSLYEHCSPVWRPTNVSQVNKFDKIQKRAVKWIFNESYCRYSVHEYFMKQKQLKILPIDFKFLLNDLVMFHKNFYNLSVVKLPYFIVTYDRTNADGTMFQRQTRNFNDSDRLKVKCTIHPRVNAFKNSFFYRVHLQWNELPLDLRMLGDPDNFKGRLEQHLWLVAESNLGTN